LNAPSFPQGPGIHGVETELVEQIRHDGLRVCIIAGNRYRAAVLRSRRLPLRGQLRSVDMVERLDTFEVGRCACKSSVVVDSLSSSAM
jgi:hypothetical protein